MNREIKFRAWDGQEMHHNVQIIHGKAFKNGYQWFLVGASGGIPMQYTGLKDRNGIEIYEGDLCADGNGATAPIEWSQDHCQFLWMYEGDVQEIGEWCIVVGNIYEGEKTE